MRIMRPGRCLRVVLHREQRQRAMAQAFQSIVVQVDVGFQDLRIFQRIRIDGEVVIVRRDLNLAGLQLLYWMVAAVVAELEFVRLAAQREADKLMSRQMPKIGVLPISRRMLSAA